MQRHLLLTDDIIGVTQQLESKRAIQTDSGVFRLRMAIMPDAQTSPLSYHDGQHYIVDNEVDIADMEIHVRRPIDLLNHRLRGYEFDCFIAYHVDMTRLYGLPVHVMDALRKAVAEMARGDKRRLIDGFL